MVINDFHKHKPKKDYFVGLDSDGTVFNSMELKHKDCFIGSLIRIFDLAPIAHEVHIVWNYVNIFSSTRGTNRFKALFLTFNYLKKIKHVKISNVRIPDLKGLKTWINESKQLSNDSLIRYLSEVQNSERLELRTVIEWSDDVNRTVKTTARNLPPMIGALDAINLIKEDVDLAVISNTPLEALHREWSENNIVANILYIGGQETGTKTEMLKAVADNKYRSENILIIGDAPGDYKAARNINALFFPIIPLQEEESWLEFNQVGYEKFIKNSFIGEYQNNKIQKFESKLNLPPPWEN